MYSETRIRQILHEFKMQRDFYQKTESYDRLITVFKTEWEVLNNKIILLQTILEESEWQKLMFQDKKKKWYEKYLCKHEYKYIRLESPLLYCIKCGKIK